MVSRQAGSRCVQRLCGLSSEESDQPSGVWPVEWLAKVSKASVCQVNGQWVPFAPGAGRGAGARVPDRAGE
ncbi:hypothetical protein GCM10010236_29030 [Streptomyces eurythermus]|nr:hypothetical protein GCM10010236_29030 [Streptomyces eurythermus]